MNEVTLLTVAAAITLIAAVSFPALISPGLHAW